MGNGYRESNRYESGSGRQYSGNETESENQPAENQPAFDYSETNHADDGMKSETGERRGGVRLLTSIQIFGSLAVLAAALALRFAQPETYRNVREWYLTAVNDSIVAEDQMDQAKHTVVGLWNDISAAGLRSPEQQNGSANSSNSAKASSSSPASSMQESSLPASSQQSSEKAAS